MDGFETGEEEDEMDQSAQSSIDQSVLKPVSFTKLPSYLFANYREIGEEATWTLSSAKSGNGAESLRNGDTQTYWQSDGSHPHRLQVQFHRRAAIMELAINCNHKLDESYTPKRIRFLAGNDCDDLELVVEVDLDDPAGWVMVPLFNPQNRSPLRCFVLQMEIMAMMQNGRDTHVRGVRLFGPRSDLPAITTTQALRTSPRNTLDPYRSFHSTFLDMSTLH